MPDPTASRCDTSADQSHETDASEAEAYRDARPTCQRCGGVDLLNLDGAECPDHPKWCADCDGEWCPRCEGHPS